jgi:predicted RNA-binding Zn-ribbon protein involved in translation (DUF1610 family)
MNKKVTVLRDVKRQGTSLFVRLGMDVINQLNLSEGDTVEVVIEKIDRFEESERYIIHCDTPIIVKEGVDVIDCPICGQEIILNEEELKTLD